jgi:hypothetical protein
MGSAGCAGEYGPSITVMLVTQWSQKPRSNADHRRIVWDATAGEEVTCGRTGLSATCGQ